MENDEVQSKGMDFCGVRGATKKRKRKKMQEERDEWCVGRGCREGDRKAGYLLGG